MDQFEFKLRDFVTEDKFTELKHSLKIYTTHDDVNEFKEHLYKLNKHFELYLLKDEYEARYMHHNNDIDHKLTFKVGIPDFNEAL